VARGRGGWRRLRLRSRTLCLASAAPLSACSTSFLCRAFPPASILSRSPLLPVSICHLLAAWWDAEDFTITIYAVSLPAGVRAACVACLYAL